MKRGNKKGLGRCNRRQAKTTTQTKGEVLDPEQARKRHAALVAAILFLKAKVERSRR